MAVRAGHGGRSPARRRHGGDRRADSPETRRRALRSPVCRWAATSPSPCCGRRPSASPGWRCSTPAARPDTSEQTAGRHTQIAMAQSGRYGEIPELAIPRYLNAKHQRDDRLTAIVRQMIAETGPEAFVRQQQAIMSGRIRGPCWRRSAVRHWLWSAMPMSQRRRNSTRRSPTHSRRQDRHHSRQRPPHHHRAARRGERRADRMAERLNRRCGRAL